MKPFNYREYRKNRFQVNFLLGPDIAGHVEALSKELHDKGAIPQATIPCVAKLGLKVLVQISKQDPRALFEFNLKKGEL